MEKKIRDRLEELRESLRQHRGDLEVVGIENKLVKLRLKGACGCCPNATLTLKQGIESVLREEIDPDIVVEQVA